MSVLGYLNPLFHLLVNFIIAKLIGLSTNYAVLVGMYSLIIDVDHIIYFLWTRKNFNLNNFVIWAKKEYDHHNPHIYIFHFIETAILFVVLGSYLNQRLLVLIGFSFTLHILTDSLHYYSYYRSTKPWLKFLSITYNLLSNEKEAKAVR